MPSTHKHNFFVLYISGMARLRLFQPSHAALWAFRKIIYLFFIYYFYCKV